MGRKKRENRMTKMTKEEKESVNDYVHNEGFDYAFRFGSSFKEIEDEEFQKRRRTYVIGGINV